VFRRRSNLLVGALVILAAVAVATAAVAQPGSRSFKVRSTLEGKTALPHRIHWVAFPSLPRKQVAEVAFIIDGGKPRWVERNPPYTYSDDRGYLVTSWLSPGRHRFTVRVKATDGRRATHTVTARVLPAPQPPSTLAGKWQRTVDAHAAPKPGSAGNPTETFTPSGVYTIDFERRWIRDDFPGKFVYPASNRTGNGFVFLNDYTPGKARFHVAGEVVFHPLSLRLAEGGWWCEPYGPPADYSWSVTGDKLTLRPIGGKDACGIRGFIWTGEWTRVG